MLYFVLFLVAAALAGVVAALITASSLWAWVSIGLSVLAGLVLLVDWFRRRSGGTATAAESSEAAAAEPAEAEAGSGTDTEQAAEETRVDAADPEAEPAAAVSADPEAAQGTGAAESAAAAEEPAAKAGDDVPGEEQTDAADALIVADLDTEVLVVDEYPRYHFGECGWLTDRDTIPIAVSEARELGFSPCARCEPDAALAASHREAREEFTTRADS